MQAPRSYSDSRRLWNLPGNPNDIFRGIQYYRIIIKRWNVENNRYKAITVSNLSVYDSAAVLWIVDPISDLISPTKLFVCLHKHNEYHDFASIIVKNHAWNIRQCHLQFKSHNEDNHVMFHQSLIIVTEIVVNSTKT